MLPSTLVQYLIKYASLYLPFLKSWNICHSYSLTAIIHPNVNTQNANNKNRSKIITAEKVIFFQTFDINKEDIFQEKKVPRD